MKTGIFFGLMLLITAITLLSSCGGGTDGTGNTGGSGSDSTTASTSKQIVLSLPQSLTVKSGETVSIPLYLSDSSGIYGADVTVKFDSNILSVKSIELTDSSKNFILQKKASGDLLRIVMTSKKGFSQNNTTEEIRKILNIVFTASGASGNQCILMLENPNLCNNDAKLTQPAVNNGSVTIR